MILLAGLIALALGWAWWTGRIGTAQIPPVILFVSGAGLLARGQLVGGLIALGLAVLWYRGMSTRIKAAAPKPADQHSLDKARILLGVSRFDNAEQIKTRHRALITETHPDRGGDEGRAAELNKARDLLLDDLNRKAR